MGEPTTYTDNVGRLVGRAGNPCTVPDSHWLCRAVPGGKFSPYKDKLRKLGLLSLEKRRLHRDLITVFQYLKGSTGKPEREL